MHAVSRFCAPSQELEHESAPAKAAPASDRPSCNARATPELDVVELYRQLCAAQPNTEDFEMLSAEFNRRCAADPMGVLRQLEQATLV